MIQVGPGFAIESLRLLAEVFPFVAEIIERGTRDAAPSSLAAQVRARLPLRGASAAAADTLRAQVESFGKQGQ